MSSANHYKLNKLVRDKSVQRMENEGALVMWRELEQPQRIPHLLKKLHEEQLEVQSAFSMGDKKNMTNELSDLMDVITALADAADIKMEDVMASSEDKKRTRGGFGRGIYVDKIICPEGSTFDVYCARDPEKYPLTN